MPWESASDQTKTKTDPFLFVGEQLQARGFSKEATEIIGHAWRQSTKDQYRPYMRQWVQFCLGREGDPMYPSEAMIIEFLTHLFHKGLGFSGVNSAKAAVINFVALTSNKPVDGSSPIFQKFMRGIFTLKPALPRYSMTWDASMVLKYLRTQSPPDALSLLALSQKLAMLMVLLTGHRVKASTHLKSLLWDSIRCSNHSFSGAA